MYHFCLMLNILLINEFSFCLVISVFVERCPNGGYAATSVESETELLTEQAEKLLRLGIYDLFDPSAIFISVPGSV